MNSIFSITLNDIRQILRDRLTFMFLLAMPIGFTLMFGFAFSGSGKPADTRLAVGLLDLDQSRLSSELGKILENSTAVRLENSTAQTASTLDEEVNSGKLGGAVIVPAGYGRSLQSGARLSLEVIAKADGGAGSLLQSAVNQAAARLESASEAARLAGASEAALGSALAAWQKAPVVVQMVSADSAKSGTQEAGLMSIQHTAPGMMLQFGIAGLLTAAQVIVSERKSRCLQRLLTTRAARHEILLGHFLAIFAVIFVQFILLIGFGQLALGLNYLRAPLATLIMALGSALFIAALGLLIGALAKNDDQATIFALIPMFLFAGLGGAWVPLEVTGEAFRTIGHLTPVAWAMDGFKSILSGGLEPSAIWLPAAALLGYALLFFGLAVWKFKFE